MKGVVHVPRLAVLIPAVVAAMLAGMAAQRDEAADLLVRAKAALAPHEGQVAVEGLAGPVEVIRDRWGVPHIYASTLDDLFLAQGFVAAQDRLWQMELWRRAATGTLAEIVGPSALSRDTFARLLRYRGDMDDEWRSYGPDARRIADAFVRGVNAQIAWVSARPERLPLEFQLTGARPGSWTPEVLLSRAAGYAMTRNARAEVDRARLAHVVGVARVSVFDPPDPPVPVTVPEGLDLADITPDLLGALDALTGELEGRPGVPVAGGLLLMRPRPPAPEKARSGVATAAAGPGAPRLLRAPSTEGSNNWAVAGALTLSGRPLLANDPHRSIGLPSLRYAVHLNGPGWNVIGAGEPSLPGVAIGHNERIAFGLTIVGIDQQDLYVERLNPANPEEYLYRGQWEPMRVETEAIGVRGQGPQTVALRFTRHGPVIHVDRTRHRAYALRWVGQEPGTAGYLAAPALNVAQDWATFRAAAARWKVPSENLLYADVDGNIGWIATGLAPIRQNWSGLLPVPGHEGRYEWAGFLAIDDLPQSLNPEVGYLATANHNILPAGYAHVLGYEWAERFRFERIVDVLSSRRGFTRADFERLQHDEQSRAADRIVEALRVASMVAPPATRDRAFAVKMLTTWDAHLAKESSPAALYSLWVPHLQQAVAEALARPEERGAAPVRIGLDRLVDLVMHPTPAVLAALTGPALDQAWAEATARLGPAPGTWAWGRLHEARFDHVLATSPDRAAVMSLLPVPRGGDSTTVNATGSTLQQTHGASFRAVMDVGAWDNSTMTNVPGQSGQPASPHYGDLLPLWAAGRYHPMVFSRAAVEREAAGRLLLVPPGTTEGAERPGGNDPPRSEPRPSANGAVPPAPETAPAAEVAPVLPPFAGSLVTFDRHGTRVAACAEDPQGQVQAVGARRIPPTHVWVIDAEVIRQLGTTPGACDPVWSPDGSRLAVVQVNGLWTYSPTLEEPRQLADTHVPREPRHAADYTAFAQPSWSPDGRFIAYRVTNGADTWVEVVDVASGRQLHRSDPGEARFTWSGEGSTLVVDGKPVTLR
jgi:penicillin amidase